MDRNDGLPNLVVFGNYQGLRGTGEVPIWMREKHAEEERRRQSVMVKSANSDLLQKVTNLIS
jgi:hypothetical protein